MSEPLTHTQARVLAALMRAYPQWISAETVREQCSFSRRPGNTLHALMLRDVAEQRFGEYPEYRETWRATNRAMWAYEIGKAGPKGHPTLFEAAVPKSAEPDAPIVIKVQRASRARRKPIGWSKVGCIGWLAILGAGCLFIATVKACWSEITRAATPAPPPGATP